MVRIVSENFGNLLLAFFLIPGSEINRFTHFNSVRSIETMKLWEYLMVKERGVISLDTLVDEGILLDLLHSDWL
jgi:hypothetical protein